MSSCSREPSSTPDPGPAPRTTEALAHVLLLLTVALVLRVPSISRESLWIDEGWSLWFAQLKQIEIWGDASRIELHPPLYYALLHFWVRAFGTSDVALRSLSTVLNLLTVPVVYGIGRWTAGKRVGLLAGVLFGLTFGQLQYAHEARMYSLLVLAIACILGCCVYIVVRYNAKASAQPWTPYALLGLALALAVWSHNIGVIYAACGAACIGVWWLLGTQCARAVFCRLSLAAFICLLAAGPALYTLLRYTMQNASEFWLTAPDLYYLLLQLTVIFGADLNLEPFWAIMLAWAALYMPWPIIGTWFALHQDRKQCWGVGMVLGLSVGLIVVNLVLTYTYKPLFMMRTALPAQVGWCVLCSYAVLGLAGRIQQGIATVLVGCFAMGALSYHSMRPESVRKPPWREAVQSIARRAPEGSRVYTPANRASLVQHYGHEAFEARAIQVVPLPHPLVVPDVSACRDTAEGCPFFVARNIDSEDIVGLVEHWRAGSQPWFIFEEGNGLLLQGVPHFQALLKEVAKPEEVMIFERRQDVRVGHPPL